MTPLQLQTRAVLFTIIKDSIIIQIPGIRDDSGSGTDQEETGFQIKLKFIRETSILRTQRIKIDS
jgi:hypothetical protein